MHHQMESHLSKLASSSTMGFQRTEVAIDFPVVAIVFISVGTFGIWESILIPEA